MHSVDEKMRDFLLRLLTHEVQIALSSECVSNETNHFMKLYPTINNWRQRHEHTHVCVHLCIHQAKGQCLITNQRLEQFEKMLKKTLGCNRSASKLLLFFLKQVACSIGGGPARLLRSQGYGSVCMIQSLFLKEISCHCPWSSGHGDPTFWSLHLCIVWCAI